MNTQFNPKVANGGKNLAPPPECCASSSANASGSLRTLPRRKPLARACPAFSSTTWPAGLTAALLTGVVCSYKEISFLSAEKYNISKDKACFHRHRLLHWPDKQHACSFRRPRGTSDRGCGLLLASSSSRYVPPRQGDDVDRPCGSVLSKAWTRWPELPPSPPDRPPACPRALVIMVNIVI